jgi:hypothetical protein
MTCVNVSVVMIYGTGWLRSTRDEHHGPDVADGAVKLVDGGRYPVTCRAVSDNGLRARQAQARGEQSAHDLIGELG